MNQNEHVNNSAQLSEAENGEGVRIYFADIMTGLKKFLWLCVVLAIAFAGVAFYKSYVRFSPVFDCSATFTVNTETSSSSGGVASYSFYYNKATADQLSTTFPSILQSNMLQKIVCSDLGIGYLPASISASTVSGTNMFTINVRSSDPDMAYKILLSVMKNYPQIADYVVGKTELIMLSDPEMPTMPSNTLAWRRTTAIAGAAGFALGLAVVLLYALMRNTVRKKEDVKYKLNQTLLGVLPEVTFKRHNKRIDTSVMSENPMVGAGFRESLRALRNTILQSGGSQNKVFLVTSTAPGEGKTTVAANLAASLAELSIGEERKNVLLIDGDVRSPSVADTLGLELPDGKNKTENGVDGENIYDIIQCEKYGFSVLLFDGQRKKIAGLFHSDEFKKFIDTLRPKYDYIIIDTAPCGLTSDPAVISAAADGVVFVVMQDSVRVNKIISSFEELYDSGAKIVGCVINGASSGLSGYYGYGHGYSRGYGYGNGYGYGEGKESKES